MKVYQAEVTNRSFRTQSGSRTWKFTPFKLKLSISMSGEGGGLQSIHNLPAKLVVCCLFVFI